jgi:RHS repeat-associated protein
MVQVAKSAADDMMQAGENAAKRIGDTLMTRVADTEEANLERQLAQEAETATKISQVGDQLAGTADRGAGSIDASAASAGGDAPAGVPSAPSIPEPAPLGEQPPVGEDMPVEDRPGCNDPVDPSSGEMFLTYVDLELPGVLPLVLRRVQLSGYRKGRLFGRTWASTLDQRLEIDDDGIHFAAEDGVVLHYPAPTQPGERVLPSRGPRWPLSWNRREDRIEILQPEPGVTLLFPPGPVAGGTRPLAAAVDRNGNRITYLRNAEGVPTDVYHSGGYHVRVDWQDSRAGVRVSGLKLVDPAGPEIPVRAFRYDLGGRLTQVLDSSGLPFCFEYDDQERVTAWINRGGYRHTYEYDEQGRVVRAGGEDGVLAAEYTYAPDGRESTFTDALGQRTVYRFDERGRVAAVTDPLGATVLSEYDRFGRLVSSTDALGGRELLTLDPAGNPVRLERVDGSVIEVEYNQAAQPTAIRWPDGAVWRNEYDERGNLVAAIDPLGAVTRYSYTERGALAQVVDPLGAASAFTENAAGLPMSFVDPRGGRRTVTRDAFGRITSITDALGALTTFAWDGEGRRTGIGYPDGTSESWEYDADGNMLRYTDQLGTVTAFEYGPFHSVVSRTDPDGARYRFTHDAQLQLLSVANPAQAEWRYTYDAAGNLVGERDFDGRTLSYAYDPNGRILRRENSAGEVVEYARDALGRIVEQRVGEAPAATFAYTASGDLIRAANADCVLEMVRDARGQILAEGVDGRSVRNTYDANGRRTARITPTGRTSNWTFDAAGTAVACLMGQEQISFGYDAAGRETYRWFGQDTALTRDWDQLGRLTTQRLLSVRNTAEERTSRVLQERAWTYRAEGTPESLTDSGEGSRHYRLDQAGRVTAVSGANWTETYAYDASGNLTRAADTRAADADAAGEREYDGTRLRRAGRTSYTYDAAGRLTSRTVRTLSGGRRVWTYRYNALDQMIEAVTPDAVRWRYRYDPLGRRVAKQRLGEDGEVAEEFRFAWDGTTLAEQEHIRAGSAEVETVTWDYEPESWTPLAQDRRSHLAHAPQELIDRQFHAIVTDLVGAPTELVSLEGEIAWRRSANLWGHQVAAPTDSRAACALRFPGQYHDAETGLDYNLHRYYDPQTGRYASADPLGLDPSPNHYGYVFNPVMGADPLGLTAFDAAQQYAMKVMQKCATTGVKIPTATSVVIDRSTGIVYRGVSGEVPDQIHSLLKSRMDGPSLEKWAQGNCAEFNAVNKALLNGAKIENLDYSTVTTRDGKYYPSCRNCKVALAGANEVCK